VRIIWQAIATHTVVHTQAEYQHVMGLQEKLYNADGALFVAVLIWWIICLWYDEPGVKTEVGDATVTETPGASIATPEN